MPPAAGELTPGKRAREQARDGYVPFNHNPKEVGSRTGKAMPSGIRRDSIGMEDIDEFFASPASTSAGNQSMAAASARSVMTSNGRAGGANKTPATAGRVRGSMRDLAGSEEEEEAGGSGEMDMDIDTPETRRRTIANGHRPPPSTSRPQSSRLAPALSPSFDDLPNPHSPTSGRGLGATRGRQSLGHKSARRAPPQQEEDEEEEEAGDDFEDAVASQQYPGSQAGRNSVLARKSVAGAASSKRAGKQPAPALEEEEEEEGEGDEEEEEDEEHGDVSMDTTRGRNASAGAASRRKSSARREMVRGASVATEGDEGVDPAFGNDIEVEDAQVDMDMGDYGGGDEDMDMGEQEAEAEAHGEEEGEEVAPVEAKKRGRPPKKDKGKEKEVVEKVIKRAPARRVAGRAISVQPIEYSDGEDANGRPRRTRHPPLAYWRGERQIYSKDVHGKRAAVFVPTDIILIPEEKPVSFAAKHKRHARARSTSKLPKIEEEQEADGENVIGWDEKTDPSGLVVDYGNGEEVLRRVAQTNAMLQPKLVLGSNFTYQKVFGEDEFFAAGVLNIQVGGSKPSKPSRDNAYVFFVNQGCVEVTLHRTRFIMSEGGQFFIPRGNQYSIENVCNKEVKLFFAQARKIEFQPSEDGQDAPAPGPSNNEDKKRKLGDREVEEAAEEEEEEEEEDAPVVAPKAKRGRPAGVKNAVRGSGRGRGRGKPRGRGGKN